MCSFIKKRVGLFKNQKGFKWGFWNQRGFSLVELMVVVAIIGILASIAIPNYQRFQRKARQTEPRTNLSALYTAEKTFNVEWNFGATSHAQIGFSVDTGNGLYYSVGWGELGSGDWNASHSTATHIGKYYGPPVAASATDFQIKGELGGDLDLNTVSYFAACGAGTCMGCTTVGACELNSNKTACNVKTTPAAVGGTQNCGSAFSNTPQTPGNDTDRNSVNSWTIGAAGNIGVAGQDDVWTINQDKVLSNVQSGL